MRPSGGGRRQEALRNTHVKRPDLLQRESLTQEDQQLLSDISEERERVTSVSEGGG